ncbi:fungal-specific transcription factor, partial [Penicillium lagena]|uniref:fungal-specific transcription factor n=1 Tax=Penicillium lagena TaxID=94218 RepID=UPI002541B6F2
ALANLRYQRYLCCRTELFHLRVTGPTPPTFTLAQFRASELKLLLLKSVESVIMEQKKRAARACDECRRLKEKCEGGAPCRRCAHFQRICEFRGLPPRSREFRPYIPR